MLSMLPLHVLIYINDLFSFDVNNSVCGIRFNCRFTNMVAKRTRIYMNPTKTKPLIDWCDEYLIGVEEIDYEQIEERRRVDFKKYFSAGLDRLSVME